MDARVTLQTSTLLLSLCMRCLLSECTIKESKTKSYKEDEKNTIITDNVGKIN